MNTIESAQNPALKHLARLLRSARARRESGQAVLEGVHLLAAYLQAGGQVLQAYVPASKMQQPETVQLLSQLPSERVVQTAGAAWQKAPPAPRPLPPRCAESCRYYPGLEYAPAPRNRPRHQTVRWAAAQSAR